MILFLIKRENYLWKVCGFERRPRLVATATEKSGDGDGPPLPASPSPGFSRFAVAQPCSMCYRRTVGHYRSNVYSSRGTFVFSQNAAAAHRLLSLVTAQSSRGRLNRRSRSVQLRGRRTCVTCDL